MGLISRLFGIGDVTSEVDEHYKRVQKLQHRIINKIGPLGCKFTYMGITMRLDRVFSTPESCRFSEYAAIIASYVNKTGDPKAIELDVGKLQYCEPLVEEEACGSACGSACSPGGCGR